MTIAQQWRDIARSCLFFGGRSFILLSPTPRTSSGPCPSSGVVDCLRVGHEELSVVSIAEELAFLFAHSFRQGVAAYLQLALAVGASGKVEELHITEGAYKGGYILKLTRIYDQEERY